MLNNSRFLELLQFCCTTRTDELFANVLPAHGLTVRRIGKRRYAYKQGRANNSPLLVCHADTVVSKGNGTHNYRIANNFVQSIALDDRLGLALILYSLERFPNDIGSASVLVCDDEESGNSSAQIFNEQLRPNWLMEFDRRGVDVVTYDYSSTLWDGILESHGFDVGIGSFSDICYLDDLGVCGVNVGIGYHREHSKKCYANLEDTNDQFALARSFFRKFSNVRMAFSPIPRYTGKLNDWPTGLADPFVDDDYRFYR